MLKHRGITGHKGRAGLNGRGNTVAVNKGTFSAGGALSWGPPVFINQTTAPSTLNDKEWIAVDSHTRARSATTSTSRGRGSCSTATTGPTPVADLLRPARRDGGATFSAPKTISGNVLYDQGSRPVVGPDGTLYVFWDGSTRLASLNSTYVVKSTDGGETWSKPLRSRR